jgi:DNA invertase Pin-like site-specific DNA recombinase
MSRATRKGLKSVARPRCAILARVSTDEQHLDAQVPMLRAEAERRAFDVVAVVEDTGSGRKMDEREGLRRVLELVEARAIDVLLVAELTRVGRSVKGLATVIAKLTARDVSLVSVRESIDLSTPSGRLLVHMLSAIAQFEVECLGERTAAGLRAAAARGAAVGSAPYGSRWERLPDGAADDAPRAQVARLVPVREELSTLRRALALHAAGMKWLAVTARINSEGGRTRSGRPWHRSALHAAARNPRVRPFLDALDHQAAAVSAVSA